MKKLLSGLAFVLAASLFPLAAQAERSNHLTGGIVEFEGEYKKEIYDPENPGTIADPGESPSTDGPLRIDFVPTLNFGRNKITKTERLFSANAQLFHGETGARGNFVQVSDYRGTGGGWTLQLRQEEQFTNNQTLNHQLKGAVLSFDQSWTNSVRESSTGPTVKKEIIRIENIGDTYTLAEAGKGKGEGTWSIEFGASSENTKGMENTLSPSVTADGSPVLDATFENKPVYKNSAVTLSVPGEIMIDPVPYTTVLTWILSELP